jgi:probable HAF family extracellular repeat protein
MNRGSRALLTVQLTCLLLGARDARAQPFIGLGLLQGDTTSGAYGVSADGRVVAGVSGSALPTGQPFRWTELAGMQGLGLMPGAFFATCRAISADGSTIVGGMVGSPSQAYRWTGDFEGLGGLVDGASSEAFGVSADGSVVVGVSSLTGGEAFRWTEGGVMEPLDFLSGGSFSTAQAVSADGQVVVGYGTSSNTTGHADEAFRWTASDGMLHSLGDLAGGAFNSRAFGVSPDGLVAVGESDSDRGFDAFRFTDSIQSLGDFDATAHAASGDGSRIVGEADFGLGHLDEAFVWDADHGLRRLADVLSNELHADLTGWYLGPAQGISADGNTVVGSGTHGDHTEAWLARLPEPAEAPLQAVVLTALAALRQLVTFARLRRLQVR